ncbi:hypothetical protein [Nannocystis pusilla]|uniref:TSP C-terminal domain-containing protein n=1 Tax=Nannocystis pusilla TaxID=889268 RepID=A0ABS7TR35_9BACT|nr:hypothetical protein [Nannocystis pusilla]MBZ5710597.1 hypothetical protein [Nannocystis pusilla]
MRHQYLQFGRMTLSCATLLALQGCGGVCGDDGWVWSQQNNQQCGLTASASESESAAESESAGESTDSAGDTEADPTQGSATMGGGMHCADVDGDGFGDPGTCQDSAFPGSVPNDDDCADDNADAFPGAAEHESDSACMEDADGDGYGDGAPPEGVEPGTDCDDDNADAFPGAAEHESDSACMEDADGDGYGDATPSGPGTVPGTDCDDGEAGTFPGAAPNDSEEACMKDVDGDDWGDSEVPDGVVPGTDCDDSSEHTFAGAAPNDSPEACMKDVDGDDWGDSQPPDGVVPGSDCDDADAEVVTDCQPCEPDEVVCLGEDALQTCNANGTNSSTEVCLGGCDEVGLKCWPEFTVDAGPTMCVEFGETAPLMATPMGGDGVYSYAWSPADSLDDPGIAGPVAAPAGPTTYTIDVTDGQGLVASDNVTVYINNLPLELNPDICETYDFPWVNDLPTNWQWDAQDKELCQTVNGRPSALFCGWDLDDAKVTGTFRVNQVDNDDDWVGFMWGIQDTEHFYVFHWKRGNQNFANCGGNVPQGMTVKMVGVDGDDPFACADVHAPADTANSKLLAAPAEFSTAGWSFNTDYLFELTHKKTGEMTIVIRTKDDDAIVAQKTIMDTTYLSGKFGQYTYSQVGACFSDYKTFCIE